MHFTLKALRKSEGSKGGHIIGHTRSGKAVYGKTGTSRKASYYHEGKLRSDIGSGVAPSFDKNDHSDAAKLHFKAAHEAGQNDDRTAEKEHREIGEAHYQNSFNKKNWRNKSLAHEGLMTLDDLIPIMQQQLSADDLSILPVERMAESAPVRQDVPTYRVDILGPSVLNYKEQIAVAKSIEDLPEGSRQTALVQSGMNVVGPRRVDLAKGRMTIGEFADALGTTENTVRSLAKRCGDPDHFASMIKEKLPDIQQAHSLTDEDAHDLFDSALRTLKSMSGEQWSHWMSKSFVNTHVTDQGIADAIKVNGFMHQNQVTADGITVHGGPVHVAPRRDMPTPEPITPKVEMLPLVGGNFGQNLTSSTVPYGFIKP